MRRYWLILGIALIIFIVEVIGGITSQSFALRGDAGHVGVDICAILLNVAVEYRVKRGADEAHTRKVGGYISAILLGGVAIWVLVKAIERFQEPREVIGLTMLSVAVFGGIGNYIQHKMIESVDEDHVTHQSISSHIKSDLLQSVGVVVGGIIIWAGVIIWKTNWVLIDPITSVFVAFMMMKLTRKLLRKLRSGEYDGHHHH